MVTTTMSVLMSVVSLVSSMPKADPAAAAAAAPMVRVRAMSESARSILQDAVARSPTVAHLVELLQTARVFVFVDTRIDPAIPTGQTSLLTATSEGRYLHVVLNPALPINRRIELLGHELQHAFEIAGADSVRDSESFRRHFAEFGRALGAPNSYETAFETDAAQDVERAVRRDLASRIRDAI